ncbi:MAG TPA: DUF4184 family protein [bacterium]|nr:DUF4184 family protein [bacterium]
MPFTPLHMGPGIAVKALMSRRFSLIVFGLTQVVIDIEVLWHIYRSSPHLHRFWHTFIGATIISAFMAVVGKPLSQWMKHIWNKTAGKYSGKCLLVPAQTTWLASFSGAIIGAYSHIFLDSVYHHDIEPFYPWSSANRLYGITSPGSIETICITLGVGGLAWFLIRRLIRSRS